MEAAIQGAGEQLAQKVCEFLMQDSAEGSMGESVGWLAGTIAFEVVLGILTAGSWTAASGAMKVLKGFARILDWTGKALGVAFKALSRVGGFLLEAIQGLGRLVGNMGGAVRGILDALQEIGEKLIRFGEELLGLAGRKASGEAVEEVAEETAERGTREAVEETTEEAAEQGGKHTDTMPDMGEKLRVAAEAKVTSDALEQSGMPAGAIASTLERSFRPRYRWIQGFTAEPRGPLITDIFMIASKIKVDEVRREARSAQAELADPSNPTLVQRLDESDDAYRQRLETRKAELEGKDFSTEAEFDTITEEISEIERRIEGLNVSEARMTTTDTTDWWNTAKIIRGELRGLPRPTNPQTLSTQQLQDLRQKLSRRSESNVKDILEQIKDELEDRALVSGAHRYSANTATDQIIGDTIANKRDRIFVESREQADEVYRTLDQMAQGSAGISRRPLVDEPSRKDLPFRGPERHIGEAGSAQNHYNAEIVLPDGSDLNIHIHFPDPRFKP